MHVFCLSEITIDDFQYSNRIRIGAAGAHKPNLCSGNISSAHARVYESRSSNLNTIAFRLHLRPAEMCFAFD